jgi:hypothetical protein
MTERHDDIRQAEDVVPRGLIVRIGVGTIALGVALCFTAFLLVSQREAALRPGRVFPEATLGPPGTVGGVLAEPYDLPLAVPSLTERKSEALDGYGWIDRRRGIVRIPVSQGIDLLLAREAKR